MEPSLLMGWGSGNWRCGAGKLSICAQVLS
jgi:hypothetical protein